jgi:hypothetical protein
MNSTGRQIDSSSRASVILDSLRSANIVIDSLGDETRMELLETLTQTQLLPYQGRSGHSGGDLYGLDKEKLDQRREELYKILVSASAPHLQRVMSSEWNLSFLLYLTFCKQTSTHLRDLLNGEVKKLYTPPPLTAAAAIAAANAVSPSSSSSRRPSFKSNHVSSSDVERDSSSHHAKKSFPGSNALGKVTEGIGSVAGTVAGTVGSVAGTVAGTVVDTVGTVAGTVVAVTTTVTTTIGLSQSSSHSHLSGVDVNYEPDLSRITEHGNFVVATLKTIIAIEQEMHKMFDDGVFSLNNNGMEYDTLTLAMIPKEKQQQLQRDRHHNSYQDRDRYRCYLMSSVFDDFLDPFIQTERLAMQNLMTALVNDDVKVIFANAPIAPSDAALAAAAAAAASSSANPFQSLKNPFKLSKSNSTTSQPPPSTSTSIPRLPQPEGDFDLITYTTACQTIFNCSEQLFQAIRSSLLKCVSFNVGRPFIALVNEYKVCLQIFAEIIRTALCPPLPSSYQLIGKRKAFEQNLAEEILTCRTIMTADKLITLLPQLQNEIQIKLISNSMTLYSPPPPPPTPLSVPIISSSSSSSGAPISSSSSSSSLVSCDLDMSSQILLFEDVISSAMDLLVGSMLHQIGSCFQVFAAIPWSRVTSVGDCSPYIPILSHSLSSIISKYRKVFSWKHFETICYRFNCDFLDYFLALIMGLQKVCVIGAEQLLLDMNEIRPLLLKLPFLSLPLKSLERQSMKITEQYQETIQKKLRIIEIVLKLLCSGGGDEQIEENFYIMWPDGQERDLQVIKLLRMPMTSSTNHPPGGGGGVGGGGHHHHNNGHHTMTGGSGGGGAGGVSQDDDTQSVESGGGGGGGGSHQRGGNIFQNNKITQGIGGAMDNFKLKATNLTDKMKLGKK